MKLALRDYQREGVRFVLANKGRVIIGDDPGLGKSAQVCASIHHLVTEPGHDTLIVCPKSAIGVWQRQVKMWLRREVFVYSGHQYKRAKAWKAFQEAPRTGRIVVVNYDMVFELLKKQQYWHFTVADEAHWLRHHKIKRHSHFSKILNQYLVLATGSPIVSSPADLFGLLTLVDPDTFRSYWKFVNTFCSTFAGAFGGIKITGFKDNNPEPLKAILKHYMIRRRKKDVLKDLPPKQRIPVPLELEGEQERIYNELAKEMMVEFAETDTIVLTPNRIAQITRLRQVLVTPALIGGPDRSEMLDTLQDMVESEFDAGKPVVIFTPFTKAIPFIDRHLELAGAETIGHIRGGMTEQQITRIWQNFQSSSNPRRAIVAQILSATSFDLFAADCCFFVGYDWTAENNIQAEDRLHRSGQCNAVRCYYFTTKGTVDANVLRVLNHKVTWSELSKDPIRFLKPPVGQDLGESEIRDFATTAEEQANFNHAAELRRSLV